MVSSQMAGIDMWSRILLVCGGRDFNNYHDFEQAIKKLPFVPDAILQGGARGADYLGELYGNGEGIPVITINAQWNYYGKGAGSKRNSWMMNIKPCYCLAMPGGNGTRDMVNKCKDAGIPVWQPYG